MRSWKVRFDFRLCAYNLVILFGMVLIGATCFYAWNQVDFEYREALRAMEREGMNLSSGFQEHTYRILKDVDDLLLVIKEHDKAGRQQSLLSLQSDLQYFYRDTVLVQAGLIDRQGNGSSLYGGEKNFVPALTADNFSFHQNQSTEEMYIGKPGQGGRYLAVSRRLNQADGTFGGIAYAVIDAKRITDYFGPVELGEDKLVNLVGTDGIVRGREDASGFSSGQSLSGGLLLASAAKQPSGYFLSSSMIDQTRRLQYYRLLKEYPLIVSVGIAEKEGLATFEKRKRMYWQNVVAFSLIIGIFCGLLLRRIRQQEKLQRQTEIGALRLASLQAITGNLVRGHDNAEELFATVIRDAVQLVGAPDGHIALVDETGEFIVIRYAIGVYESMIGKRISRERGARSRILSTGESLYIEDYRQYSLRIAEWPESITTVMAYPLKRDADIIGIFYVSWRNTIYSLSEEERNLLSQYADLVSIALGNVYVHQQLKIELKERQWRHAELLEARSRLEEANQELRKANQELEQLAVTDKLTGAWNRRKFEQLADAAIEAAARYQQPLSLLMVDIDHFKKVNDRYGHQTGDQVLMALVRLIQQNIRTTDSVSRWGGEEFVIMLPHTAAENAVKLAEKVRLLVAAHAFPLDGTITVSLGAAEISPGDTLDTLVKKADDALYTAKAEGRNRTVLAK